MHSTAVSGSGPLHPIPHVSGDSPPLLHRFLSSTLIRGVTCRPPVRRVSFAFFFFFSYIHLFFKKKKKTSVVFLIVYHTMPSSQHTKKQQQQQPARRIYIYTYIYIWYHRPYQSNCVLSSSSSSTTKTLDHLSQDIPTMFLVHDVTGLLSKDVVLNVVRSV